MKKVDNGLLEYGSGRPLIVTLWATELAADVYYNKLITPMPLDWPQETLTQDVSMLATLLQKVYDKGLSDGKDASCKQ